MKTDTTISFGPKKEGGFINDATSPCVERAEKSKLAELTWNSFQKVVNDFGLEAAAMPSCWKNASPVNVKKVQAATLCLGQVSRTHRRQQFDNIADVLPSPALVRQAFELGYPFSDILLQNKGGIQHPDLKALRGASALADVRTLGMRYVLKKSHFRPLHEYHNFFNRLFSIIASDTPSLDASMLSGLAKTVIFGSVEPLLDFNILALIAWAERIWEEVGGDACGVIFDWRRVEKGVTLAQICSAAELTCEMADSKDIYQHIRLLADNRMSLTDYIAILNTARQKRFSRSGEIKSLQQVACGFSVDRNHRLEMSRAVKKVRRYADMLRQLDTKILEGLVADLQERVKDKPKPLGTQDQLQLLALASESVRRHIGITPFATQLMAVVGLLQVPEARRGRIAQVNTGEGKSTIVTLLALYQAALGYRVDIISSSHALARRDQKKYLALMSSWGIASAHICDAHPEDKAFAAQVVYGTNHDFEFSLLFEDIGVGQGFHDGKVSCRRQRPHEVVIVDEVDNLFIDQGDSSAIVSTPNRGDDPWMIAPILHYCQDNPEYKSGWEELKRVRIFLEGYESSTKNVQFSNVDDSTLESWLSHARRALDQIKCDEDYVILSASAYKDLMAEYGQLHPSSGSARIVIIDRNTGHLQPQCRWQHRQHQFVEAKHGLSLQPENMTAAELSHPVFFARYRQIFGVTGTIGSKQEIDEVKTTYAVDAFTAPPHRRKMFQRWKTELHQTEENFYLAVEEDIFAVRRAGRPCLVLMESIRESLTMSLRLEAAGIEHQVLNDIQQENEEVIVARAGREGVVTVATNTAGRGTDIILSSASLASGGLHVVVAFFADNERMELQALGRAGRQGQPGTGRCIIFTEPLVDVASAGDDLQSIEGLERMRARLVRDVSRTRVTRAEFSLAIDKKARLFFQQLRVWDEKLDDAFMSDQVAELEQRAKQAGSRTGQTPAADPQRQSQASKLRFQWLAMSPMAVTRGGFRPACQAWLTAVRSAMREEILLCWALALKDLQQTATGMATGPHIEARKLAPEAIARAFMPFADLLERHLQAPATTFVRRVGELTGLPQ